MNLTEMQAKTTGHKYVMWYIGTHVFCDFFLYEVLEKKKKATLQWIEAEKVALGMRDCLGRNTNDLSEMMKTFYVLIGL